MDSLPIELVVLGLSVVLLIVHVTLQAWSCDLGNGYLAGPRDEELSPSSVVARRFERALRNYLETYAGFVALALALVVSERTGGLGALGAIVWISARTAFIPLYGFGIPWFRSLVWFISLIGLILMLARLFFF